MCFFEVFSVLYMYEMPYTLKKPSKNTLILGVNNTKHAAKKDLTVNENF